LKIPGQSSFVLPVNVVWKQDGSLTSEDVNVMGRSVLLTQPVSGVKGTNRCVNRGSANSWQIFNVRMVVLSVLNVCTDEVISKFKNLKISLG
jgi:hypothetical protein